ncbi:efflux RND transporter periplasmic adaptor subunit [Sphingomonas sp. IW22]|uniref:efflux RND transporter periplasmic adaptor subunit n=1 Tax=Sphingomonas sp. IW22 TaxID=3242489 RepID=UPI0035218826
MYRSAQVPALALLCLIGACSAGEEPAGDNEAQVAAPRAADGTIALTAAQLERSGIRFAAVEAASEVPVATVPATVAPPPNSRVAVAAVIPGVITRTHVVEGDSVRAGQPLAEVAAREMFTIAAGLDQASARVAVARANDRRLGQLAREGVIAGARAEEARAAFREAQAELNEQQRLIRLVNGSPARGTYTLTSPIAGKVTTASVQTGSPVSEATAAYVVDATSRYELTAQLPERLVGQVRPGMAVALDGDVRGEVTSVGSVIDPQTRSATLRARIPAAPGVVSGRATAATVLAPAPEGAVTVPSRALVEVNGAPTLFVRTDAGVVARRVQPGMTAGEWTVIVRGLKPGERIAVEGTAELKSMAN